MQKSKFRYILTWLALSLMLISSTLLMVLAWNGQILNNYSPTLVVLLWSITCASGIYLFTLAIKKAHRQYVNEIRDQEKAEKEAVKLKTGSKGPSKEKKELDVAATARKLVRRIQENTPPDKLGAILLKNLAHDLEIMSGIYYMEEKGEFKAVSSYAMVSSSDPYSFKAGEGLTGQVARNQQVLVLTRLPEGHLEVYSGLGKAAPHYLAIVPLVYKGKTVGVVECSGYRYEPLEIENMFRIFARDLMDKLSPVFN